MQVGSSFEFFTHPRRTAALFAAVAATALTLGAAPAGAALITPKTVTPTVVTPTQVTSAPAPSHVDSAPASDPAPDYETPTPVETSSGSPSGGGYSGGRRGGGSAQHAVGGDAADGADDSDDEDDGDHEPMSDDQIAQWGGSFNYRTGQRAADEERVKAAVAEMMGDGSFSPDFGDAPEAPAANDNGAAPEAPQENGNGFATLAVNAIDSASNLAQNLSDLFSGDAERSQGDVVQQMISDFLGSRNEQIASNCQCSPAEIGPAAGGPDIGGAGSSAEAADNSSSAPESSSSDANSSQQSPEEACQCSLPEGEGGPAGSRSLDDLPPKFEE